MNRFYPALARFIIYISAGASVLLIAAGLLLLFRPRLFLKILCAIAGGACTLTAGWTGVSLLRAAFSRRLRTQEKP